MGLGPKRMLPPCYNPIQQQTLHGCSASCEGKPSLRRLSHAFLAKMLHTAGRSIAASLLLVSTVLAAGGSTWSSAGHDLQNTRYQNTESKISAANAGNLAVQWQFTTAGDVSATPAVDGSTVYFPDSAGNLYAVNRNTGALIWSRTIASYTGVPGDFSRTTPAIAGNALIFGDQAGKVRRPGESDGRQKDDGRSPVDHSGRYFPVFSHHAVGDRGWQRCLRGHLLG